MRVLVAEDDEVPADAVCEGLRYDHLAVDVVYDGADSRPSCAPLAK